MSKEIIDERDWSGIDPSSEEWREREAAFRESLRRSTPVGPNPYQQLDAALLDPEQLQALTRILQGRGNSYDRSICERALSEQRQILGER